MKKTDFKKYLYPADRRTFLRHMMWLGTGIIPISGFSLVEGRREIDEIELTYHHFKSDKLKKTIKIVHLTDLHFEEDNIRENTIDMVNNQQPDLILMTGDYTNTLFGEKINQKIVKDYVNKLKSKYGIYASFGNWDVGFENSIFNGTEVRTIRDNFVELEIEGNIINLIGLDFFMKDEHINFKADKVLKRINSDTYNILLFHAPDLIEHISPTGKIDLYLSGHTHGGQIRFPFLRYLTNDLKGEFPYYGAVITFSKFGTKYQSGLFTMGQTKLYVSRGIGVGPLMPLRIFCRPEIGIFTIGPDIQS